MAPRPRRAAHNEGTIILGRIAYILLRETNTHFGVVVAERVWRGRWQWRRFDTHRRP